jgi:hypothetical protein
MVLWLTTWFMVNHVVENIFIETIWLAIFGAGSSRFKFDKPDPLP